MPQNILTSRTSNWIHIVSLAWSNISQAPEGRVEGGGWGPAPAPWQTTQIHQPLKDLQFNAIIQQRFRERKEDLWIKTTAKCLVWLNSL